MADRPYNVLFTCTGNSARSILAKAFLNHLGRDHVKGFSAGSSPRGAVHPMTLTALQHFKLPTEGYRSKSWEEFAHPDAPTLDFVFTVCDQAAGEACPVWPRPADDRPLGYARSGGGRRPRCPEAASLSRCGPCCSSGASS